MNHVYGSRFSYLDPQLFTARDAMTQGGLGLQDLSNGSTGWSSYDQGFLGEDRPHQVLTSLMPSSSDSYEMSIPIQPAYSSVARISTAPSSPALYLPEYLPGQSWLDQGESTQDALRPSFSAGSMSMPESTLPSTIYESHFSSFADPKSFGQNIPIETQYSSHDTLNCSTPVEYSNFNACGDLAEHRVFDNYINAGSVDALNEGSDACAGSRL